MCIHEVCTCKDTIKDALLKALQDTEFQLRLYAELYRQG